MPVNRYVVRHPHTGQYLDYRATGKGRKHAFLWTDDSQKALHFYTDYAAKEAANQVGVVNPEILKREME